MHTDPRTSRLLRLAVGLPALGLLVWLQIARLKSNGLSVQTDVVVTFCGIGAALAVWGLVAMSMVLPARNLLTRLDSSATGGILFVARTTRPQLRVLRHAREPKLRTYFVVRASEFGVEIWNPGQELEPYARQPWAAIETIRKTTANPSNSANSYAIEMVVAGATVPVLALVPSRDRALAFSASEARVDTLIDGLVALRTSSIAAS